MNSLAQQMADQRNTALNRDDIEWIVSSAGELMLRDKPSWTEEQTLRLSRNAESDRRQHAHRQKHPVQEAAS